MLQQWKEQPAVPPSHTLRNRSIPSSFPYSSSDFHGICHSLTNESSASVEETNSNTQEIKLRKQSGLARELDSKDDPDSSLAGNSHHFKRLLDCNGIRIQAEHAEFLHQELYGIRENLLDECGILSFGIQNTAQGIRNPTYDWNQERIIHSYWNSESKLHWQRLEFSA